MTLQIQLAILLAISLIAGSAGSVAGYKYHKSITDAAELASIKEAEKKYKTLELALDASSTKILEAEATIQLLTKEKIRYVPQVTSNKPCLSASAVQLLNSSATSLQASLDPSLPKAESSSASPTSESLSDTDVAYWITEAQSLYDTCAERQHAAVDILLQLRGDE
jgi:hypothetical protein